LGGLFFGHAFLFAGPAQLFVFWLLPYDHSPTPKANKTMCCMCEGTKSMTKNKPEGHGSGAATKNAGANRRFLGAAWVIVYSFRLT